ncbi:unnamed protein product [Orchesella dallaii]|uniref:C2H2-type domain-containing protein n=1 Tax=Orchesella dallaii TaxID=48710 RepID=A0ABP1Q4Z2_9HEXA
MAYWGSPIDLCIVCNSFIPGKLKVRRKKVEKPLKYRVTRKQRQKLEDGLGLEVTPHLRPFFVIKEIFKLPKENVCDMLRNLGNPSEWFEMCETCSSSIDEGIEVLGKLKRLEERFAKIKKGLHEKVHTSRLEETKNEVETLGLDEVKTAAYRRKIRNSLPTICPDEPGHESYFESESLQETGDASDLEEPNTLHRWNSFMMVEMDAEITSSDNVTQIESRDLSLTAEKRNVGCIKVNQEYTHVHLDAATSVSYESRPSTNKTTPSQPPKALTFGVKCSDTTQKRCAPLKRKLKDKTCHFESTTDAEIESDPSDGVLDDFDKYSDPPYFPGQPLSSARRKPAAKRKRKKILSQDEVEDCRIEENEDEHVGFLNSRPITRSQKILNRAHSKGSVQKAKQVLRKCPQTITKRVGRPPIRDEWSRILNYGNDFLDMSLITYPPKTMEEKRKIPKGFAESKTAVLKEYGELSAVTENSCPSCGKYFSHKYFAISHIHRFHLGIRNPWTCNQCSRKFMDAKRFVCHLKFHDAGKIFSCPICKSFMGSSQQKLDHHLVAHQEHVPNPACDPCGKVFIDFQSYLRHMSVKHGFEYRKYFVKQPVVCVCEVCSKTFKAKRSLKFHQVTNHGHVDEEGMFPICPHCGKLLQSALDLEHHIQKEHVKATNFFCDQCGAGFVLKNELNRHIGDVHNEATSKTCHVCNFVVKNENQFRKHMNKQHPEVLTMSVDELEAYKKKLNDEKPHKCTLCDKSFAFSIILFHHYRNEHPEVTDKFRCEICGKGYSRACSVKRHYESAHEKKMVQCQYCDKEVAIGSLYIHQKAKSCVAERKVEADAKNSIRLVNSRQLQA